MSGVLTAAYIYNYDEDTGRLESRGIRLNNSNNYSRTENFVYDNYGMLVENGEVNGYKTKYIYDVFDRMSRKTQAIGTTEIYRIKYEYDDTSEYKLNRVKSITNLDKNNARQTYTYNSFGYVATYNNPTNGESFEYSYDSVGRLKNDKIYSYTYDQYNNITQKTGEGKTVAFEYDAAKRTRLKSVTENGSKKYFAYDANGYLIAKRFWLCTCGKTTSCSYLSPVL